MDAETGCRLIPLERVEAVCEPYDWPWARTESATIERHWVTRRAAVPALFNGPVLLSRRHAISAGTLRASYFRTDYKSFLTFKELGFPDPDVRNGFAMAALRGSDGPFVLGVMGTGTANAGRVYFPAGTPDLNDLRPDGTVDLAGSVTRELHEETGLGEDDYRVEPGWTLVRSAGIAALMRPLRLRDTAAEAVARIRTTLLHQAEPELSDVVVVRSAADLDTERMPVFIRAYLADAFAQG